MDRIVENARIFLRKAGTLHVSDGYAMNIACLDGCLWITQDGDPRDIILKRGESFTLDRPGVALLHAFEASVVSMPKGAWVDSLQNEGLPDAALVSALSSSSAGRSRHPLPSTLSGTL